MNIKSAKRAQEFATYVKTTPDAGLVYRVPGHEGRVYFVKLNFSGDTITATCKRQDGSPCKGNGRTICYHALAAILHHHGDTPVALCRGEQDAERLARIATAQYIQEIARIESTQGNGVAFAVVSIPRKIREKGDARREFKRLAQDRQHESYLDFADYVTTMNARNERAEATLEYARTVLRGESIEI